MVYIDIEAYAAAWKRRLAEEEAGWRELAGRAEEVAKRTAAALVEQHGATEVWLFGSLVRGRFRPGSDIDLAARGLPPQKYFRILSEINAGQEFDLDLIDLDACPPWLAEAVRQHDRLLARRNVYGYMLEWERLRPLLYGIPAAYEQFRREISAFQQFLLDLAHKLG